MPTSSGQERDFIDSTTNTICILHTIQEGSTSLFIAKETQEFRKPQLNLTPILKWSTNLERRCRSRPDTLVGLLGGRPTHPLGRLVSRPSPTETPACQLVDRAVDRYPATVVRAVDRATLCTFVHTGRLGTGLAAGLQLTHSRSLLAFDLCTISPDEFKKLYQKFLYPLSLHIRKP